jgi:hypothetical protein
MYLAMGLQLFAITLQLPLVNGSWTLLAPVTQMQ